MTILTPNQIKQPPNISNEQTVYLYLQISFIPSFIKKSTQIKELTKPKNLREVFSPFSINIFPQQTFFIYNLNKMSHTCLYIIIGLIFLSSGYLAYMNVSRELHIMSHIRYWLFFGQHILLATYLIWNQRFQGRDEMGSKLKALLIFSGINFFVFLGFQIYAITNFKDQIQFFGEPDQKGQDFANASYLHLYYQYNIYNGVFFIFCFIMMVFYVIHRRNQERDFQQVVQGLDRGKYEAQGLQDPCSICLVQFQKGQECLKLECSHIFHKECLTHWIKEHMTCPMCRDDIRARILHRNRQVIQGQDF